MNATRMRPSFSPPTLPISRTEAAATGKNDKIASMSRDDAPPGIAPADHLYRGFPAFSAWGKLPAGDADLWNRFAAGLAQRRQQASPESLQHAVEVAVRAAALDTGALEGLYYVDRGFTMTVAVQGLAWQQMVEERGAGVRELFEAQLAAYELVLDAVTQTLPITEAWIRALHETLCAPQKMYRVLTDQGWQEQELPKGQYKNRPNHVHLTDGTVHAYAPVDQVATEMHRFIEQIRTPEFESAHAVLQASYCHYAFVSIHPFADGNGRVARALASTFFYRAQSIPLLIFGNQRPTYLDALALADHRDYAGVIEFFRDRGFDTMQLVAESLMTAAAPKLEYQASRINRAAKIWKELSDYDLRIISDRILRELRKIFQARVVNLKSQGLSTSVWDSPAMDEFSVWDPPVMEEFSLWDDPPVMGEFLIPGYKRASTDKTLILWSQTPQPTSIRLNLSIFWSLRPHLFPFLICVRENEDRLEARLEDITPELTPIFLRRLDQWVQRQLAQMLTELARQADA
jgi:Fic family protein